MPPSPAGKPFSFAPGSGSAPSSPLAKGSSHGNRKVSSSAAGSAAVAAKLAGTITDDDQPGLLSRNEESTFHRQLRALLLDHKRHRTLWEETATYDGLKAVKDWSQADEDVQEYEASLRPREKGEESLTQHGHIASAMVRQSQQHQLAFALQEREAALAKLQDAMTSLHAVLGKLTKISDQVESTLLEASKSKGLEFAFRDGMWSTWTLERFSEAVRKLTSQYTMSTAHLQLRVESALHGRPRPHDSSKLSSREREEQRERARRAMSEAWALLPFLDKSGPDSARYLEDVCRVEVGRWESER